MSLRTVVTKAHLEQLERLWNELKELQDTLGVHEEAELPGLSGQDLEWDLAMSMLHVMRAQTRVRDVLEKP